MQPGPLTATMRSRANERFDLSKEQQINTVYMPFVFAHKFGHAVQRDPEFHVYFGNLKDDYVEPEQDCESYVNSQAELNAEYIAAVILGNSELGMLIDYMPPKEPPTAWQDCAEQHPIPNTIALQKK